MRKYYDLSIKITAGAVCSFQVDTLTPKLSFIEGSERELFLINTKIDNLRMDVASHVLQAGCLPNVNSVTRSNVESYIGRIVVLDVSFVFDEIKKFYDETGTIKIDLDLAESCEHFIFAMDRLMLNQDVLEQALEKHKTGAKNIDGILFYTGMVRYHQNKKSEAWQNAFFLGLSLSQDLLDMVIAKGWSFLGIDTFKFGHSFFNFSGLEKIFISSKAGLNFYKYRMQQLQENNIKCHFLKNNIKLYQALRIDQALVNCYGEFIGLPLPIDMPEFDNVSLTYPILGVDL